MKLWRNCGICNQDFLTESEVCPNNVGHVLIIIKPRPVEEAPPVTSPEPPAEMKPEEGSVVDAEFESDPAEEPKTQAPPAEAKEPGKEE